MFTILSILIILVMAGIIRRLYGKLVAGDVILTSYQETITTLETRLEQLHWLHGATINRMNEARTGTEDAETLTRELNAENVKLVKLVMALEAAMATDYVSNLN